MESPSKPPAHGFAITSHASPVPTALSVPNTPASSNSRMDLLFAAGELISPNGARSNCDGNGGERKMELIARNATTASAQGENATQFPLVPMHVSLESDVKQPLSAISRMPGKSSLPLPTMKEPRRRPKKQKRGPGRPRKHPLPEESNTDNPSCLPPPKKKGPGRPRKQDTEAAVKKGPGRPKKYRGPGRPRKHPLPTDYRGPGRPRKPPSPKKPELPVFGPARRVGRPFKVPVLVSEFLPPGPEQEKKPPAVAQPKKPIVRQLTRKGRPQKLPTHLNDMVVCVGKKPSCNWMKVAPGNMPKQQQSSLGASTGALRTPNAAAEEQFFLPVEDRVMDDGSMLPKREPKAKADGTYIRPVGRAPPGTIWDKYRGLWIPYSNLKQGESSTVALTKQAGVSISEFNVVSSSSQNEGTAQHYGIATNHPTARVEDSNVGS